MGTEGTDLAALAVVVVALVGVGLVWIWLPYLLRKPPAQHPHRSVVFEEDLDEFRRDPHVAITDPGLDDTGRFPVVPSRTHQVPVRKLPAEWTDYLRELGLR